MHLPDADIRPAPHKYHSTPADTPGTLLAIIAMAFAVIGLGVTAVINLGMNQGPSTSQSVTHYSPHHFPHHSPHPARHFVPHPVTQLSASSFFPPETIAPVRSPLLLPGEHLSHLIPYPRLAKLKVPALPTDRTIPWSQANWYVGHYLTIVGRVVERKNLSNLCILHFTRGWQERFSVVIFPRVLAHLPDTSDDYFIGHTLKVTGKVTLYHGHYEIKVYKASQIVRLP